MRIARLVTLVGMVAWVHLACSSNSDTSSVSNNTGGGSAGTGGASGAPDNACKATKCPNVPYPTTDTACNLLLQGPCKAKWEAAFACSLANDVCIDGGVQDAINVFDHCQDLYQAGVDCLQPPDGGA